MANLKEAFVIPLNCENLDFVKYPYVPIQIIGKKSDETEIASNLMTIGRCFDIKYGAKNCYAPTKSVICSN